MRALGRPIVARSGGVVLYALLCGSLPFDDENVPSMMGTAVGWGSWSGMGPVVTGAEPLPQDQTRQLHFAQALTS